MIALSLPSHDSMVVCLWTGSSFPSSDAKEEALTRVGGAGPHQRDAA